MASAGVPPRVMGIGPVPSTRKLMERLGLKISDFDVVEINEAFASQSLACLRQLGLPDDAEHVNPHGGAIALGLATMCVGVGQGVSVALERVNRDGRLKA
jgi:3-oxoadipyl-CoA thiolase